MPCDTRPVFELHENGTTVTLKEPYTACLTSGNSITVPAGATSDFASVPRIFWRVFPRLGRYSRAAVVHDYLYSSGVVSRKEADDLFLLLMQAHGVPAWQRYPMWCAVRAFGFTAYKHTEEDEQ